MVRDTELVLLTARPSANIARMRSYDDDDDDDNDDDEEDNGNNAKADAGTDPDGSHFDTRVVALGCWLFGAGLKL